MMKCPRQRRTPLPNIDGGDLDNQLAVVEFVEDICKFYRRTEVY
jgi:hypothetical protein